MWKKEAWSQQDIQESMRDLSTKDFLINTYVQTSVQNRSWSTDFSALLLSQISLLTTEVEIALKLPNRVGLLNDKFTNHYIFLN